MWHEARKSEKKVLGMMVDMQKRAERRRAYYEKLGEDPMQLLRLTGNHCKLHLDPAIAAAAESSTVMVALRCDSSVLIDRWDVRASMDIMPKYKSDPLALPEMDFCEQQINYERYRVLIQNEFRNVEEEGYLQKIDLEELYPRKSNAAKKAEKKRLASQKAAIGYRYDDGAKPSAEQEAAAAELAKLIGRGDSGGGGSSEAAGGLDGTGAAGGIDGDSSDDEDALKNRDPPILIDSSDTEKNAALNRIGLAFGLSNFTSMVTSEVMEAKMDKEAEEMGNVLAAISSRASRQNRSKRIELRREKDQLLMARPSYAQRASPTYEDYRPDRSDSDSDSSRAGSPTIQIISGFNTTTGATVTQSATTARSSSSSSGVKSATVPPSSRRHGEAAAASWPSSSSSSSHHHHHRLSSPDRDRNRGSRGSHVHSSLRSRSRSPHSSRHSDYSQHGRDEHSSSRYQSRSPRSRSRDRDHDDIRARDRYHDRDRDHDRYRHGHRASRSPKRSSTQHKSHSRSRSHSAERDRGLRDDRRRRSPDHERSTAGNSSNSNPAKPTTETGALAAAKKLIQSKGAEKPKLTPQERLKLKMQLQLARTQKTDRAKEATKAEKEVIERQERMDEIEERTRKMREKERRQRYEEEERRYGHRSPSPDDYDRRRSSGGSRGSGSSHHY